MEDNDLKLGQTVWVFAYYGWSSNERESVYLEDFYLCECTIKKIEVCSIYGVRYTIMDSDSEATFGPGDGIKYVAPWENIYATRVEAIEHLLGRLR